jgi:hypothetical protein
VHVRWKPLGQNKPFGNAPKRVVKALRHRGSGLGACPSIALTSMIFE